MDIKLRPIWPGVALTAVVSLGTMLGLLTIPLFMMMVYRVVVPARSWPTLQSLFVGAAIAILAFAILNFIRGRIMQRLGQWLAGYLGLAALETSVTNVLYGGKTSSQVLRDVSDLQNFVAGGGITSAIDLLWVPLMLIILFLCHWSYALIVVIGMSIMLLLAYINDRVVRRPTMQANEMAVENVGATASLLRSSEIVHALGLGPRVALRWARAYLAAEHLLRRPLMWGRIVEGATFFVERCVMIAMIATSAVLLILDTTGAGRVFGAMLILRHALGPVRGLVFSLQRWATARACYDRIKAASSESRARRSDRPLSRPQGSLEVDRLVFVPPGSDRAVLRGISFTVEPGEVLGVIGPSGAGKSTLARMLVGLWRPSSGGIYLDGQSVYLWERTSFGKNVGYLPQKLLVCSKALFARISPASAMRTTPTSWLPRSGRGRTTSSPTWSSAIRRRSATPASCCRVASVSASPWRGRCSAIRTCSCSMSPTPISTRPAAAGSPVRFSMPRPRARSSS